MAPNVLNAMSVTGLALILSTEACLWWGARKRSHRWETRGRFLQMGVIVIYSAIVFLAIQNT